MKLATILGAIAFSLVAWAQVPHDARLLPKKDRTFIEQFGQLPAPGSVRDVLICAGANEVLWADMARKDPYSREANDAKRKAGWYAAVALHVFAVESKAVLDAVDTAKMPSSRKAALETARSCRAAPENWRE